MTTSKKRLPRVNSKLSEKGGLHKVWEYLGKFCGNKNTMNIKNKIQLCKIKILSTPSSRLNFDIKFSIPP